MFSNIKLIVGLGNPGKEYEAVRHSIGRRVVMELGSAFDDNGWSQKPDLLSDIKNKNNILLALPTTFMNESGKAVGRIVGFYKIKPANVLVIHDDSDIPFGKIKLSFGSRSAGHRGVESVIKALGTKDFWRLRLGIQPKSSPRHVRPDELVLKPFFVEEEKEISEIIKAAISASKAWLEK